ncbi:MAG: OmpW family outer membrane protein [Pseudomonadota bacterium]
MPTAPTVFRPARIATAGSCVLLAALMLSLPATVYAEAGDFRFRIGSSVIRPDGDNGLGLDIDDGYGLTFNGAYFVTNNFAVELLAAAPYLHDIQAEGGGTIGEVKHLPPTLSAQWYFTPDSAFSPYVGLGVNYTLFWDEELGGADVNIENSLGWAAQVGADFALTENTFVNVDVRFINIEADAKVNGTVAGELTVDPVVFGLHFGYQL